MIDFRASPSLRARVISLAAPLGLLAFSACSLTTSLDDLRVDHALIGDASLLPDAAIDAAAPSTHDAASHDDATPSGDPDATALDAPPGDDAAGASDTSAPETSTTGFCASNPLHTLCDDFDGTPPLAWTESSAFGTQGIDSASATSAPSSFFASTNTISNGSIAKVMRMRDVGKNPTAIHLEYSTKIETRDASHGAALGSIEVYDNASGQDFNFDLAVFPSNAQLEEWYSNVFKTYPLSKSLPVGSWVRVSIDAAFGPSGSSVTVRFDGQIVLVQALRPTTVTGDVRLYLGVTYAAAPNAPWKVRYDDVLLDVN